MRIDMDGWEGAKPSPGCRNPASKGGFCICACAIASAELSRKRQVAARRSHNHWVEMDKGSRGTAQYLVILIGKIMIFDHCRWGFPVQGESLARLL